MPFSGARRRRAWLLPLTALAGLCCALPAAPLHASDNAVPSAQTPAAQTAETAEPTETRELWTGSLYSSTYRAGVCLGTDGKARGVLLLRVSPEKVDVYHFNGEYGEGGIKLRHSSGHVFKGRVDDPHEVTGTITLKNGFNIKLKGARTHDVELTETCRPLPEGG